MEKIIKKRFALLFGAILTLLSFSSCTDQDDVEISYNTGIRISAAHLFQGYTTMGSPSDFEMDGNQTLCLDALIYDESGNLVLHENREFGNLNSTLEINPSLKTGDYTLISIASFKSDDYCWKIENTEKKEYLTITNTIKYTGVFTTLGVTESNIEIGNKSLSLDVDIKPVTALIGIFYWNNNPESTTVGYTPLASYVEETILKVDNHNTRISFFDNNIHFEPISDGIIYEVNRNYPLANMRDGKNPINYSYYAMLPKNGLCFYPTLKFTDDGQQLLDVNEEESGQNTASLDIESGKQYVLDFVLAAPKLFFSVYNSDELSEERMHRLYNGIKEELNEHNLQLLKNTVDYNFHSLIGQSKSVVDLALNLKSYSSTDDSDTYIASDDMLGKYVVVNYWDSTKTKAKQIVVVCEGCFVDDSLSMDSFHQFLVDKYIYQEEDSNSQVRYYFSSEEFKDTKYVVILDNVRSYLIYDAPELH